MIDPFILVGYIANHMPAKAVELFKHLEDPNEVILTLTFKACAQLGTDGALQLVKSVVPKMPIQYHKNVFLLTSLLDALMQCRVVNSARSLFDSSERKANSMYGAMMKGKYQIALRN